MKYKLKSEKEIVELYFNVPDMPLTAAMGYRIAIMAVFDVNSPDKLLTHEQMLYLRRKHRQKKSKEGVTNVEKAI